MFLYRHRISEQTRGSLLNESVSYEFNVALMLVSQRKTVRAIDVSPQENSSAFTILPFGRRLNGRILRLIKAAAANSLIGGSMGAGLES